MKKGDKVKTPRGVGKIIQIGKEIGLVKMENGELFKFFIDEFEPIEDEKTKRNGIFLTKDDFYQIAQKVTEDNRYLDLVNDLVLSKDKAQSITLEYKLNAAIAYLELAKILFGVEND